MQYTLKLNKRARSIRITVRNDGTVLISAPRYAGLRRIEQFVMEKQEWILEKQKHFASMPQQPKLNPMEVKRLKKEALLLVEDRLKYYSSVYGIKYGRISIRGQKTRWGSCSRAGNLNFNYRIATLSRELADYIVVHELCHIKEFNHSKNFWALVEQTIPEYRTYKAQLRKSGKIS